MLYREIIVVCSQIHTKHINTLCGQNVELYIKIQSVPHSKHSVSVIKTTQLMLYREIIAVCSKIHTKSRIQCMGRTYNSGYKQATVSLHSFINTNLIHNFLYKLHKIQFLCMFRASSAHLQEVSDVNCICMQPLVYQRLHTCTINIIDLLKMSG